ncbi:MAG: response regulator, partial [Verrucomicrobiota bacterium]
AEKETVHIVLLDLNLPDMTGAEVLQQITSSEKLRHTPVVVVSTSDDQKDVLEMYRLRCNSYVVKPSNFDDYVQTLRTIFEYWSTVMVLPDPDGLESPGLVNPTQ